MEAGETFSFNVSSQPLSVFGGILEFDNTAALKTVKLTTLTNGNNTIYTTPAGKTALLVTSGDGGGTGTFGYWNASGASRNVNLYIVPNGGSAGVNNQWAPTATVPNGASWLGNVTNIALSGLALNSGDSIVVSTNAATATQVTWVTILEF